MISAAKPPDVVTWLTLLVGHPFARYVRTLLDNGAEARARELALALLAERRKELLEQLTAVRTAEAAFAPVPPESKTRAAEAFDSLVDALTALDAGALASAHACASHAADLLSDPHAPLTAAHATGEGPEAAGVEGSGS
jgi:hypothetical protein